jgi:hypothetical protein
MRYLHVVLMGVWAILIMGCGAPREAGVLARQEAALLAAAPADDAAVRSALAAQADAWETMAALVQRRDVFGTPVDAAFIELVQRTAVLACRQRDLIAHGQDDPALNRQNLERLQRLWSGAARYLGN